jgi:hypothetical protein
MLFPLVHRSVALALGNDAPEKLLTNLHLPAPLLLVSMEFNHQLDRLSKQPRGISMVRETTGSSGPSSLRRPLELERLAKSTKIEP